MDVRRSGVSILTLFFSILSATQPAWADPSPSPSAVPVVSSSPAAQVKELGPTQFVVDNRMRKNVDFWVKIYSQYTTRQGVVHDAKYIDKIYEVLDFTGSDQKRGRITKAAKRKYTELLLSVHHKRNTPEKLTPEEKRIYDLFADVQDPNKFLDAAHRKRMRFQLGQKDRFEEGLRQSGKYLPIMEEIFRKEGLPWELTRLPFVESSFNLKARSKVGASGIWQFMRSTGRLFLRIDEAVDERNDPIRAAEAAAQLLKSNYASLGKWPLAVTAYNHGRMGMMRAVRMVGSPELEDVVGNYKSRTFGFASGNFFTCLLAAIEVERNAEKYFGKVEREKPLSYFEVKIPDYINMKDLTKFMKLDRVAIRELNPGLTDAVYAGERLIPAGYQLRLPHSHRDLDAAASARVFLAGYSQIPGIYKHQTQKFKRFSGKRAITGNRTASQ